MSQEVRLLSRWGEAGRGGRGPSIVLVMLALVCVVAVVQFVASTLPGLAPAARVSVVTPSVESGDTSQRPLSAEQNAKVCALLQIHASPEQVKKALTHEGLPAQATVLVACLTHPGISTPAPILRPGTAVTVPGGSTSGDPPAFVAPVPATAGP